MRRRRPLRRDSERCRRRLDECRVDDSRSPRRRRLRSGERERPPLLRDERDGGSRDVVDEGGGGGEGERAGERAGAGEASRTGRDALLKLLNVPNGLKDITVEPCVCALLVLRVACFESDSVSALNTAPAPADTKRLKDIIGFIACVSPTRC